MSLYIRVENIQHHFSKRLQRQKAPPQAKDLLEQVWGKTLNSQFTQLIAGGNTNKRMLSQCEVIEYGALKGRLDAIENARPALPACEGPAKEEPLEPTEEVPPACEEDVVKKDPEELVNARLDALLVDKFAFILRSRDASVRAVEKELNRHPEFKNAEAVIWFHSTAMVNGHASHMIHTNRILANGASSLKRREAMAPYNHILAYDKDRTKDFCSLVVQAGGLCSQALILDGLMTRKQLEKDCRDTFGKQLSYTLEDDYWVCYRPEDAALRVQRGSKLRLRETLLRFATKGIPRANKAGEPRSLLQGAGNCGDEVFQNIPLIHPKDMPKIAYKDKVLCIPNMEMPLAQDDQTDAHSVVKPPVADDMVTFHHMEYHVKFLEQLIEEFQAPGKANVMVIDTCGAGNVLRASSRRGLYTIVLCENEATVAYLKEVARVELATRLDEFGGAGLKANLDLMGLKLSDVTLKRKKKTLQTKLMFKRQKTGTATENATSSSSSSDSTVDA